jgi:hypothetical protein
LLNILVFAGPPHPPPLSFFVNLLNGAEYS